MKFSWSVDAMPFRIRFLLCFSRMQRDFSLLQRKIDMNQCSERLLLETDSMLVNISSAEPKVHRVALLFHASKIYDREVIAGIGSYVNQTRVAWDPVSYTHLRAH